MQRHHIVIPKGDGGVEVYPMKQWLRDHPEHLPPGMDPSTATSHQLRGTLLKRGWTMEETPQEVSLIPPGQDGPELDVVREIEPADEPGEIAFSLEYQLRDFIASNLSRIDVNGKRLRLYIDPAGPEGIEFRTDVGFIDILAVDEGEAFYVFELKRATSPDKAIGQLARYMGWLKHTIGKDKDVHGIIVARAINERLRYAVSVIPNVSLFEYEVEFHLRPAHDLSAPAQ